MIAGLIAFALFVALLVAAVVALGVFLFSGLQAASFAAVLPFVLVILAAVVARRFARTWRSVRSLIGAAGSLADGDYSVRVTPRGPASMRPVAASFNEMARRLETADEQRRRLLADLGHELRTPLTIIRGEIEAMVDGVHELSGEQLDQLLAEVAVMERLLEDLRTLSLIDAGVLELYPESTDLVRLLGDVAEAHRRRAADTGVEIIVEAGTAGDIDVDPVRMREVLTNLVVNSLRAMPHGGELRLAARSSGNGAVIEVVDTGTGVSPDEIERVFDRFQKGAASSGSGLGLSISRDLVAAHGGTLTMTSVPGSGTTVRIDLSRLV